HKTLEGIPSMLKLFTEFIEYEDTVEGHLYLTMIYADAVAQNLGWVTDHSRPKILLGAFLHDIGKLKLPKNLRGKKRHELSGTSLEEYEKHCRYGVELLDQIPEVGEQIKQIVYQHHELVNGEGFPNGFAGSKIYPLAKIVGFANQMANLSVRLGTPPYFVIKKMIQDKDEIFGYDPEVVKAFIKCFVPGKKK
ncbi:MAG: HD domain-containing phosphohydrolase, partial [Bacteriovoracaceae bacterium]